MPEYKFTNRQYKILKAITKDSNLDNILSDFGYSGCDDYLELYNTENFESDTLEFSDNRFDKKTEVFLSNKTSAFLQSRKRNRLFTIFLSILSIIGTVLLERLISKM